MEKCNDNYSGKNRVWGVRSGDVSEIVAQVKSYLKAYPMNYQGQVDTLLEWVYHVYTEYNSVETPELKKVVNPLDETLRSLAGSDEEADVYMNYVFELWQRMSGRVILKV